MNDLPITIRPGTADDYGFILASWSREYHKTFPANFIPNSIYVPHQTRIINQILLACPTYVACFDDDNNNLVGYLVGSPNQDNIIIHHGFVKSVFRRNGVMKELLRHIGFQNQNIIISHMFDYKLFIKTKDRYNIIYDPTLLDIYK